MITLLSSLIDSQLKITKNISVLSIVSERCSNTDNGHAYMVLECWEDGKRIIHTAELSPNGKIGEPNLKAIVKVDHVNKEHYSEECADCNGGKHRHIISETLLKKRRLEKKNTGIFSKDLYVSAQINNDQKAKFFDIVSRLEREAKEGKINFLLFGNPTVPQCSQGESEKSRKSIKKSFSRETEKALREFCKKYSPIEKFKEISKEKISTMESFLIEASVDLCHRRGLNCIAFARMVWQHLGLKYSKTFLGELLSILPDIELSQQSLLVRRIKMQENGNRFFQPTSSQKHVVVEPQKPLPEEQIDLPAKFLEVEERPHELKNQNGEDFKLEEVLGDGDCGYESFRIARKDAYTILVGKLADVNLQKIICFAVKEAIWQEDEFKFIEYMNRNIMVTITKEELIKRDNFDIVIMSAYLKFDIIDKKVDMGWAHPAILQALAYVQKLPLYIWEYRPGNKKEIVPMNRSDGIFAKYIPEGSDDSNRIDILFSNDNHFDRLIRENPIPKSGAEKPSFGS